MTFIFVSLVFFQFLLMVVITDTKVVTLGVLLSWGGWAACGEHGCGGGVAVAVEEINSNPKRFATFHSQGHHLDFTYADTACDVSVGLPYIPEMFFGHGFPKIDAFIGPGCSVVCEPGGHMAKKWNIPMVSFVCTSTKLSNKELYPTFARTAAPSSATAPFYGQIMKNFGYDRAAILYSSHHVQVLTALAINDEFLKEGIIVSDLVLFEAGSVGKEQEIRALREARKKTRGR